MIYKVIGIMSGSSLDGLDIVYADITEIGGKWNFEIQANECLPYNQEWLQCLKNIRNFPLIDYLKLHTAYGKFIAKQVNHFINKHDLAHKVHFIASHGHTVYHSPQDNTSVQLGDGATIAALTGITTISDLRNMDVALGGQGAPIVAIFDKLLFSNYEFCLNIGGIANITVNTDNNKAFDICVANQLLNHWANRLNLPFDDNGNIAAKGKLIESVFNSLNALPYHETESPKSLDNGYLQDNILPLFEGSNNVEDNLHTSVHFIAFQIAQQLKSHVSKDMIQRLVITGGGAKNDFLIKTLKQYLPESIEITIPEERIIDFKEALAMALIGTLRWREEVNVYEQYTGATRNSVAGAIWLGN